MAKLPHLYQKLLTLMQEHSSQKYIRRKTLHGMVTRRYHLDGSDIDIAMKELSRRKAITRKQYGVFVE